MTDPAPDLTTVLPSTRRGWAAMLADLGVRPRKGLGQHFLYESGIVQRLVRRAGIGRDDLVLEIGPGLGILTAELLRRAGRVVAIELDPRLAAHLRRSFGDDPRFSLIEGNALDWSTNDLIPDREAFTVAANLPYAVGSAVVRHLLEQPHRPRRLAVMLQKEVAMRMVAEPPDMSILGVACQFYAEGHLAFDVSPEVFLPPPSVESAVIILDVRPAPLLPEADVARFFRIVNAGFRQKRKQVANSLAAELALSKEDVTRWLTGSAVDPMRRAQTLTVEEWVSLTIRAPDLAPWPEANGARTGRDHDRDQPRPEGTA